MNALCDAMPAMVRCKRVVTRAPEAGGEDYEPVDAASFCARAESGDFVLWWHAHGLYYGIPKTVQAHLGQGQDVLANLSRPKLIEARDAFAHFLVLSITAKPEILEQRLATRGREAPDDRAKRLARASLPLPDGLPVVDIDNSGPLDDAVMAARRALQLASA